MSIKTEIASLCWRFFGTKKILKEQTSLKQQITQLQYQNQEILKALSFNSTINNSKWLKYKNFSPGNAAVDYSFLYTLYKTLNSMKPNHLLEFGLGQSSKVVHQYANYYHVNAITCEHDNNWYDFFIKGNDIEYDINVRFLDLCKIKYKGFDTLSYSMDNDIFKNKYDFILVDGPFGSSHYSRSQIIYLVQKCLLTRFCIIIDDYERPGEQETVEEIYLILKEKGIIYYSGVYYGTKQHIVICSEDLKFLTSL